MPRPIVMAAPSSGASGHAPSSGNLASNVAAARLELAAAQSERDAATRTVEVEGRPRALLTSRQDEESVRCLLQFMDEKARAGTFASFILSQDDGTWNNPDNFRTSYKVQDGSDLINVYTLRNEQQSGAGDSEEEQITRAEFVQRMIRVDSSQYSTGIRNLRSAASFVPNIWTPAMTAAHLASVAGGASGSAAGAADEAPPAAKEGQDAPAVGSYAAATRDPGTKEAARADRLEEIRKQRESQKAAASGEQPGGVTDISATVEPVELETVLQKSWSYTLYRHVGGTRLFLSVVCGSSALFDRNVELRAHEVAAYEKEGPASIDALAKQITYSPDAYTGRHIKNLLQWPVKIEDTEEAE
jgi:hypothetical protein